MVDFLENFIIGFAFLVAFGFAIAFIYGATLFVIDVGLASIILGILIVLAFIALCAFIGMVFNR